MSYYGDYRAAGNALSPPEHLAKLAVSEYVEVRRQVARNPNTPPAILSVLTEDGGMHVLECVLGNPSCPPLVRLYFQCGRYSDMTLQEFLEATR